MGIKDDIARVFLYLVSFYQIERLLFLYKGYVNIVLSGETGENPVRARRREVC